MNTKQTNLEERFKANLCKCNKCDLILIDQNPQIGAIVHTIFIDGDKQLVDSSGKEVATMEYLGDEGEYYWGCPVCETDSYLTYL